MPDGVTPRKLDQAAIEAEGDSTPAMIKDANNSSGVLARADNNPKALSQFGEVKIEDQGAKVENQFKAPASQEKPFNTAQQPASPPGDGKITTTSSVPAKTLDGAQPGAQNPAANTDKAPPAQKTASDQPQTPLSAQARAAQTGDAPQTPRAVDAKLAPATTIQPPQETGRLINGQEVKAQHPVFGPTSAVYEKQTERGNIPGLPQGVAPNDLVGRGLGATAAVAFAARDFNQSPQALATRPAPVEPGAFRGDKPNVPDLPGHVASIRPEDLGKLPSDQFKAAKPEPGLRQPDFKPEFKTDVKSDLKTDLKPDLKTDLKSLDGRLGETKLPVDKTMTGRLPEGGRSGVPIGNTAVPWRSVGDKLDDIVKRMEQGGRRAESGRVNKDWEPGSRRSDVNAPWGGRSPLAGPKDGDGKGARAGRNEGAEVRGERAPKLEGEKPGRSIGVDGPKLKGIPVGADLKVRFDDWRQNKQETPRAEARSPSERAGRPYVSGEAPARQYTLKIDPTRNPDGDRSPIRSAKTEVPITQPPTGVDSIKNFIGRMKDHVEHALTPWKNESGRAVDSRLQSGVSRPVENLGTARQSADNKNEYVLANSKDKLPIEHKEMNTPALIAVLIAAGDKGRQLVREVSTHKFTDTTSSEKTQFATKPETSGDTTIIKGGHKPFIRLHLPDGTYGGDKVSKGHRVAEFKSDPQQESETVPLKPIAAKQDEIEIENGDTHIAAQPAETPVKPHQESERRYVNAAMDALEQTWSSEDDEPAENGSLTGETLNAGGQNDEFQGGLNRYRFRVGPDESVESIALTVLKDPALAPLLYKKVRQHVLPEKEYGIHPLPEGIIIDLPTPSEIAEFRRSGK